MLTEHDARRIATGVAAIRPDWHVGSMITLLAECRARDARDVHLALIWLAYDPTTRTPARLREDGPWWHLGPEDDAPPPPAWTPPEPDGPPATPEQIARYRARIRQEKP